MIIFVFIPLMCVKSQQEIRQLDWSLIHVCALPAQLWWMLMLVLTGLKLGKQKTEHPDT